MLSREPAMAECKGKIHSFESFGAADGPGVRFVVFMQGCDMRCRYCHNADTWAKESGLKMTPEQVFEKALRYKAYWGKNGGITVSGGEPLLQTDFVTGLFKLCRESAVNTAIDTSAQPFTFEEPFFGKFKELIELCDLVLLDIKHIDSEKHKLLTGKGNENILAAARYLSDIGKPVWIRHVLVPGINDDEESLSGLSRFLSDLTNVQKIEVLPYHNFGAYKWESLGLTYTLADTLPPAQAQIRRANEILTHKKSEEI